MNKIKIGVIGYFMKKVAKAEVIEILGSLSRYLNTLAPSDLESGLTPYEANFRNAGLQ